MKTEKKEGNTEGKREEGREGERKLLIKVNSIGKFIFKLFLF